MTIPARSDLSLFDSEIEVLRDLNGEMADTSMWGGDIRTTLWALLSNGLVDEVVDCDGVEYRINDAGRVYLLARL